MITWLIKFRRPILYVVAAALVVASLLRAGYSMGAQATSKRLELEHTNVLRQHEANYKQIAINLAKLQSLQRQREQRLATAIQEQDHAYQNELDNQKKMAAGLGATVQRLRATVAGLNQQRPAYVPGAGADPGTSCSADDATVARELFAESAAEYGSLAADAEQLRGQVVGLQRYVSTILAGQDAQTKVGD